MFFTIQINQQFKFSNSEIYINLYLKIIFKDETLQYTYPIRSIFLTTFELNLTQYTKRAADGTNVMWNVRISDLLLKFFTHAEVHN